MQLCLFEDSLVSHLSPLTQTRGVYEIRTGALTNLIRLWELFNHPEICLHARTELASLVQSQTGLTVNELPAHQPILFVNGRITSIPADLLSTLLNFAGEAGSQSEDQLFVQDGVLVAAWILDSSSFQFSPAVEVDSFPGATQNEVSGVQLLSRLWHLIDHLQENMTHDIELLMRHSPDYELPALHPSVVLVEPSDIFIAPDATISPRALIDATSGPVYINRNAHVMDAAIVRGPAYVGQKSVVKPRADFSGSALGPVCKAGGEVVESIFQSFSNKAHEGFLGHAYLGTWCNIGAGTHASNLKNDYGEATLYNEGLGLYEQSGRQFLGVIMGDHSKLGISCMVNTATVIGVACNLFGSNFLPRHLESFSWGSPDSGFEPYRLDKAKEMMTRVMTRRNRILSDVMVARLEEIFSAQHAGAELS